MDVLVVGGGGREHAIVSVLGPHKKCGVVPGNAGTASMPNVTNLKSGSKEVILKYCKDYEVKLVVIGPEAPIAEGLSDYLRNNNVKVFGPSQAAAFLEYDKAKAKDFMARNNIPTAEYKSFTNDPDRAKQYILTSKFRGWAIKAAGLAGGKGVVVSTDRQEACKAVDDLINTHPTAAQTIVVEEMIRGVEMSLMCFTDGTTVVPMLKAQDYKRRYKNDGPNTGGMGAICPYPQVAPEIQKKCENIAKLTVEGLTKEGLVYSGVLYLGLMLSTNGRDVSISVLEYNCRFGDPETEAVLPLLQTDLYTIMEACADGNLKDSKVAFKPTSCSCALVVVTKTYPAKHTGPKLKITGLQQIESDVVVFHNNTELDGTDLVTSGGRVLTVVATGTSFPDVRAKALKAAECVKFDGAEFRRDIGFSEVQLSKLSGESSGLTYSQAGVNVSQGDEFVSNIKDTVAKTRTAAVLEGLGGFGALYDFSSLSYKKPVLVTGTDGVGTKLLIAQSIGKHDTIGLDLVAMCLNDIMCHGAEPLLFLDYIATGALQTHVLEEVVRGIARGCAENNTALVGGETAEMPGMYCPGAYDVAGFALGVVEKKDLLPKKEVMLVDDILIGVPSSGLHSNGYSLVRKIIELNDLHYDQPCPYDSTKTLGEALLEPTIIYSSVVRRVKHFVLGIANITGGGIIGNVGRMLPDHLAASINEEMWTIPPVFNWISRYNVSRLELFKTFNMGLGLVLAVKHQHKNKVLALLEDDGATVVGALIPRQGDSVVLNHKTLLPTDGKFLTKINSVKTAVMISGRGSNLKAILEATLHSSSIVDVALIISNRPKAEGLKFAQLSSSITPLVIDHTAFESREKFEDEVQLYLEKHQIQLICLAGFMRILTASFVNKWPKRIINIHPSLLPSFKGKDAQKQALAAGVKLAGCTVHYVDAGVDTGEIISQASVAVHADDTEETLSERIRAQEHVVYPMAVKYVAKKILEESKYK